MSAGWLDLVDPTQEELLASVPLTVDPELIEALAVAPSDGHEPRPLFESHGAYVFGVFLDARPVPEEDRISYREVDLVATPEVVVTVRKTPADGRPWDPASMHVPVTGGASAGELI